MKKIGLITIAAAAIILSAVMLAACSKGSSDLKASMDKVSEIDAKYGMSLEDYSMGLVYLKYHPRYPNPINLAEIDPILEELKDIRDDFEEGSAAYNYADARVDLLESEKYHKMATKTAKGDIKDGFRCSEEPYIKESAENYRACIQKGREAADELNYVVEKNPDEAGSMNITKFSVKYLNSTYDMVEESAYGNNATFYSICLEKLNGNLTGAAGNSTNSTE